MSRALVYLTVRSAANRVRRKAGRLRTPRYALAFVLGAAFLWVFLVRQPAPPSGRSPGAGMHRELVMAILTSWAVAWAWAFGGRRVALAFSLPEVEFLFPAPISRRALIRFKLFHSQGPVLWSVLIWTLMLSRSETVAVALLHAAGIWMLLSTLQLHRLGASLARAAVAEHRGAAIARRWGTIAAVLLAALAAAIALVTAAPALAAAAGHGTDAFLDALERSAERPLAHLVLLPFRMLVRPAAATDPAFWLRDAFPALLLLTAHFVWVTHADASFEESAAEAAARRAERLATRGAGRPSNGKAPAAPIFHLAAEGRPAAALFWKNIIAVGRADRFRRTAAGFALVVVAVAALAVRHVGNVGAAVGALAGSWAVFAVIIGPQWVRNDLRTDLQRLELLRSYPVRGAAIVGAEVAGSAVILTLIQLMLAAVAAAAFLGEPWMTGDPELSLLAAFGVCVVLPAVNYLGLLLLNGGALLFPAWVRIGPARTAGIEGLGQNVVVMAAYGLGLTVALVPAALAAGVAAWAVRTTAGSAGWVAAGLAGLVVIAAECRLLLAPLGRILERIDLPSAGIDQQ